MGVFKKYKLVWFGLIVVALLLSLGTVYFIKEVNTGKIKSGWSSALLMSGTSYPGKVSKNFKLFSGVTYNKIKLEQGESVTVAYDSNIQSGDFEIVLIDENDNLIKSLLEDGNEGAYRFTSQVKMKYYIKVIATDASGSYEITWKR